MPPRGGVADSQSSVGLVGTVGAGENKTVMDDVVMLSATDLRTRPYCVLSGEMPREKIHVNMAHQYGGKILRVHRRGFITECLDADFIR